MLHSVNVRLSVIDVVNVAAQKQIRFGVIKVSFSPNFRPIFGIFGRAPVQCRIKSKSDFLTLRKN